MTAPIPNDQIQSIQNVFDKINDKLNDIYDMVQLLELEPSPLNPEFTRREMIDLISTDRKWRKERRKEQEKIDQEGDELAKHRSRVITRGEHSG